MKTIKRKIAIIALVLILMFTGNSLTYAQSAGSTIEFRPSVTQANTGDEFDVDIYVQNPDVQNIISVRSWLSYDSSVLEGVSITTSESLFGLSAPGEDEFSPSDGHVKIGRSNISGGVSDSEAIVAKVRFKVKTTTNMTTEISSHDYQVTELGHTSVNIIEGGFPVNILSQEPDSISIHLNSGSTASTSVLPPSTTEVVVPVDNIGGSIASLERPKNLKANTGSTYVDLKWDLGTESDLMGYNIFYGKTSGTYTRLKTVPKVNSYRIDGLNNNEAYYFAITAYDKLNRQSDYSNEVGIIVNSPLSSTAPFEDISSSLLATIPSQTESGPLVGWVLFSAVGLGGTIAFRRKGNSNL